MTIPFPLLHSRAMLSGVGSRSPFIWFFAGLIWISGCGGCDEWNVSTDGSLGDASVDDGSANGSEQSDGGCASITCNTGQSCAVADGVAQCLGTCTDIECTVAQSCDIINKQGQCVADCEDVICPTDYVCDESSSTAKCVADCGTDCTDGEHCEIAEDTPSCVENTCADLSCGNTEVCADFEGGGKYCEDISCDSELDCDTDSGYFCDSSTGTCQSSVCLPYETQCNSGIIETCFSDGSGYDTTFTCVDDCTDASDGDAYCGCEDDWDCPAYTVCEVGRCEGTGREPTCTVPTQAMSSALPTQEIEWGGTAAAPTLPSTSPFTGFGQVVQTPVVANLNDDNGDGLINEHDYPEIIFSTFCADSKVNDRFKNNGVLRAIHGGGTTKGEDYFATCGTITWNEGDDPTSSTFTSCTCPATPSTPGNVGPTASTADVDPTAGIAVGDLDDDGVPEIITILEEPSGSPTAYGYVQIYDNEGVPIATSGTWSMGAENPTVAIANIDGEGYPEIVVGRSVLTLKDSSGTLDFDRRFEGTKAHGQNGQGPASCVADLDGDGDQEIIAGASVYEIPTEGSTEDTANQLVLVWDGKVVNGSTKVTSNEGFCAVADVWGATASSDPGPLNPLDGQPEVIVVSNGLIYIFNGLTGELIDSESIDSDGTPSGGGPPNVDDFDGDGFPEIGTAGQLYYVLSDLQTPTSGGDCDAWTSAITDDEATFMTGGDGYDDGIGSNPARSAPSGFCTSDDDCNESGDNTFACNENTGTCVCYHNSWLRGTQDKSSQITGSSVFDFNGDGAAEVVYNDECYFRVYDGRTGAVYFREPSESRTRIENPVVADVDNDGNAEIVFGTSNESGFCHLKDTDDADGDRDTAEERRFLYNNGIEVWGDSNDYWVSARRIYNQHAYHITNVTEAGAIPQNEPPAWDTYQGRVYNSYRSNPQSLGGVAPDLLVEEIQVTSPDATCGELSSTIEISAIIKNDGDLRVGPGVEVSYYGTWDAYEGALTSGGIALTTTLDVSLEPGESTIVSVTYDSTTETITELPNSIQIIIDESDSERECDEENTFSIDVDGGTAKADLTIEISTPTGSCEGLTVPVLIENIGSESAVDPVISFYAGSGGTLILSTTLSDTTLDAGDSLSIDIDIDDVPARDFKLYAVIDPNNDIVECNDANNTDTAVDLIECAVVIK